MRRAIDSPSSTMAASMSARSIRSWAKVRSLLTDLTSSGASIGETALSSLPCARSRIRSAFTPNTAIKSLCRALAMAPSVRMPRSLSIRSAAAPIPLIARTGRGLKNARSVPGMTIVRPWGLSRSLAILATVLLDPRPMEQVIPSLETRAEIRLQISTGFSVLNLPGVTSKKASSIDTWST